jgi:FdhE protein
VVQEVLNESTDAAWETFVPARAEAQQNRVPLLAEACLVLEAASLTRWIRRLIRAAVRSGAAAMATLEPAAHGALDVTTLFTAALCHDSQRLQEAARDLGADPDAFKAVAFLIPVPFLHACNRRLALAQIESWTEGYCPCCGAWPAFAEVRGIERSRYLRCSRCGGEWRAHCLFCPYCATTDHNELISLVPETGGSTRVIEACKRCLGYMKTFTTLQGSPPAEVMIRDLASVDLDLAALEHGYKRPAGGGYSLDVTIVKSANNRFFPWKA